MKNENTKLNKLNNTNTETAKKEIKTMKKNYYELKKAQLVDEAIDYQQSWVDYNYSYGELAEIWDYFYTNVKKYGLVREFRENGII